MVSLINFKIVNEELQEQRQQSAQVNQQHEFQNQGSQLVRANVGAKLVSPSIVFADSQATAPDLAYQTQDGLDKSGVVATIANNGQVQNFVVTWRKLRFAIEPKWHQKIIGPNCAISFASSASKSANNIGQPQLQQVDVNNSPAQQQSSSASKIVLDELDGSFRSGELTAILGPSGAGKTTLLDCLTGHRKTGLSGSIKISSSRSSAASLLTSIGQSDILHKFQERPSDQHHHHQRHHNRHHNHNHSQHQKPHNCLLQHHQNSCHDIQHHNHIHNHHHHHHECHKEAANRKENVEKSSEKHLKVSIIPQNDHLMGHLTVYETLNYASKMKNCFDKQFNHKLNIRRVAQQLGLMSCLGTRINKLSGGQYKRVSIAQELLSSPDILILDEPTSGLDAMTCYQTVQVLRKLTDQRQLGGQNSIAVILTIHQPNSDVFQQFNHVYVVAQGGKCIYEGSPGSIESVINRVGISLPNSYYNPATMIVEIAAGKFGQEAINKLNGIQKRQYTESALRRPMDAEQNSTGDSAVDCPSTSSSSSSLSSSSPSSSSNDEDEDEPTKKDSSNDNNNNSHCCLSKPQGGLVNKGFVMEADDQAGSAACKEIVVVVGGGKAPQAIANHDDHLKMINCSSNASCEAGLELEGARRKKRRRTRRRSSDLNPANPNANGSGNDQTKCVGRQEAPCCVSFATSTGCAAGCACVSGGGGDDPNPAAQVTREKRLKLNSLKADQKFPFWRHTYLHFHRSWLSIVRDPMLCSMQLALHIIVPVMVSLVYGTEVGKPNACPRAGPMDIMAYALEPADSALQLQEDLRTTLENIGYIFFKLYGIIFAAMTVTVLTFPFDMHVLVKEFRNGWYGLSSYFLGRTLADIPFQLTLPLLAMSLSYYATGQPYSYMQWRFLSITAILILSSLIAQSQGLLFGAILMDRMKAAVFVAPAATTPIILFAGFLVRTQSIPRYLRPLSNLSYLRYAIEACLISRYGFNQCECDPAIFNQTVPELPPIARSMLDYWLSSFKASAQESANNGLSASLTSNDPMELIDTTTVALAASENPDLFTKLIDSLAKANSFGRNITSCEQVVPYPMIDYDLKDSQLFYCFGILLFMLVFTRLLTFFIVCFKVKRKV